MNNMLIAICGLDGSGKSTQVKLLGKAFEPRSVTVTKQPSDWYRSDPRVRGFLDAPGSSSISLIQELALLSAADRLRHLNTVINPALAQGHVVITDRYVYSAYAYFHARGVTDIEWLHQINRLVPQPTLTVFLDVDPKLAWYRIKARDDERIKREDVDVAFLERVRNVFLSQPWSRSPAFVILDGALPADAIHREIWKQLDVSKRKLGIPSQVDAVG